jgi:hypothetical protein
MEDSFFYAINKIKEKVRRGDYPLLTFLMLKLRSDSK